MQKKHKKYRLFYLLLLLFMTSISLSVSTYAWFTSNRFVSIDLLNVNVRAQGSLEISSNGKDFKSILSIEDLLNVREVYPGSVNQIPGTLEPVSSGLELDNGKLKMFYGNLTNETSGNYYLSAVRDTESNNIEKGARFIAFDIFLRTNSPGRLYLPPENNITYLGDGSTGIENAVRVAFVREGNVQTGSPLDIIQNLSTNNLDDVYIWEPNYDTHTENGIKAAKDIYGINTSFVGDRITYDGIKDEIDKSLGVSPRNANSNVYPQYFKPVDVDFATKNGFTESQEIFNIQNGITKFRVYMWIEGQDVDCENNASIGNVTFNLQFSINPS